jgi:hypothetical protein
VAPDTARRRSEWHTASPRATAASILRPAVAPLAVKAAIYDSSLAVSGAEVVVVD